MTIGETRVRITFNPSDNSAVSAIKQKTAQLIDLVAYMPKPEDPEKRAEYGRLVALAMTDFEKAAMWAVKAATMPE